MHTGLDLVELPKAMRAYLGVRTKAMHLGTTSGLITKKFRGAFSRLAFREGCPLRLYSDNGYTFLGAEKALIGAFSPQLKHMLPRLLAIKAYPGISSLQASPWKTCRGQDFFLQDDG